MSPSASQLPVDFSATDSSNLRFSAIHFYSVYTVVSLACLHSRLGTLKHIQIHMKLSNNFSELFGTDGGVESKNVQEFFLSPWLMSLPSIRVCTLYVHVCICTRRNGSF